jgi:hypothetical protein
MNGWAAISTLVYRLFLLSWIFAVLWVKEYLWWTFTLAALLLLLSEIILPTVALAKTLNSDPAVPRSNPVPSTKSDPMVPRSNPVPSTGGGDDDGDPDVWREPKPPRSSSRTKKT